MKMLKVSVLALSLFLGSLAGAEQATDGQHAGVGPAPAANAPVAQQQVSQEDLASKFLEAADQCKKERGVKSQDESLNQALRALQNRRRR